MRIPFATPVTLTVASLILGAVPPALSQTTAGPDPLDPRATVPPLVYRSVLQDYRPHAEAEVGKWLDTNDRVGRIGGWRAYARQAAAPDKPASAVMERKP